MRSFLIAGLVGLLAASGVSLRAQDDAAPKVALVRAQPPAIEPAPKGGFRKLAAGVERTISPETQKEESASRHDLGDVLKSEPMFGERPWSENLAKDIRYQHNIWALEFTFKPVRFVSVDLPNLTTGRFTKKTIWYMVYRVKNLGDGPVRFIPRFLLHSEDKDKYYPDRLIPLAIRPIQLREDPKRALLDSVSISDQEVPPSPEGEDLSVWGVVTWQDIDPRTDRFSIFIQGLTNAYRWTDAPAGPPKYQRKTLQLNFWRPSDDQFEHEREIRFGQPENAGVDYLWLYK